ncbi:Cadherin-23 [Manis javanica]|nr:Cadherin-23 [Manis javanica]
MGGEAACGQSEYHPMSESVRIGRTKKRKEKTRREEKRREEKRRKRRERRERREKKERKRKKRKERKERKEKKEKKERKGKERKEKRIYLFTMQTVITDGSPSLFISFYVYSREGDEHIDPPVHQLPAVQILLHHGLSWDDYSMNGPG